MPSNAIFISYSRQNSDFVSKLIRLLSHASIKVWHDRDKIIGGDPWDKSVQEAIEQADAMILVLSKDSMASDIVRAEYTYALDHNTKVIPIKIEECKIDLRLHPLHHIDFSTDSVKGQQELSKALNLSGRKAKQIINSKVFKRKKSRPWLKIVMILVLIGVAYGFKDKWLPLLDKESWKVNVQVVNSHNSETWLTPNWREIDLVVDDTKYTSRINEMGIATFVLDSSFSFYKTKEAKISLSKTAPYKFNFTLKQPDSTYYVSKDAGTITVEMELQDVVERNGIVLDSATNSRIDGAKISYFEFEKITDTDGSFKMILPALKLKDSIEITAFGEGYQIHAERYSVELDSLLEILLPEAKKSFTRQDERQFNSGN